MTTHINPETGEHGKCTASVRDCPYQKQGNELGIRTHFKTIKEAKLAGEQVKENIYGSFKTLDKDKKKNLATPDAAEITRIISDNEATAEELDSLPDSAFDLINFDKLSRKQNASTEFINRLLTTDAKLYTGLNSYLSNIAELPNCPKEIKRKIEELKSDRVLASRDATLTAQELKTLLNKDYSQYPKLLQEYKRDWVDTSVLPHDNLDEETKIAVLNGDNSSHREMILARHKADTPAYKDAVMEIARSIDDKKLQRFAHEALVNGKAATAEDLHEIANQAAENNDNFILGRIGIHQNTTPELLKAMSKSRSNFVKSMIAANNKTPDDVLIRLSNAKNSDIVESLIDNEKELPVKAQTNIAKNNLHNLLTMPMFARNDMNAAALDILADSSIAEIREEVKKHPKTSMKTLLRMNERERLYQADEDEV